VAAALVLLAGGVPAAAGAQGQVRSPEQTLRATARLAGADSTAALASLAAFWNSLVEDPALLNRGLDVLVERGRLRLLQDLKLRFVSFESGDAEARGLGISYALANELARTTFRQQSASEVSGALSVRATGNVAFDRRVNPRDFLTTSASLHVYGSHGGVDELQPTTPEVRTRLNELTRQMAQIASLDAIVRSPATREYLAIMQRSLTSHVFWDLSGNVRLESDQAFDTRQFVYGAVLGGKLTTPGTQPLNVVDLPFAAVRWLTGSDRTFSPRGSTIPSVQLEIAAVDPRKDERRATLGETGIFPRVRFESGFRTPVYTRPDGRRIFFDADYRLYQELGASAAVEREELDRFSYFAAALVSPDGPFVSYSTGRLPFDRQKDRVFELGFTFDF
jgi:hypothetical protein